MKLNLGCGARKLAGFVNVDKEGNPDERHDLETFPWPWKDSSAEEVVLSHVLEHLGQAPAVFIKIMQELYRVCAPSALVRIAVPHPRHDHFLGDPTHVRPITPEVLSLFSQKNCAAWVEAGAANTPLALYHDIDFEIVEKRVTLERRYFDALKSGDLSALQVDEALRDRNNVATEFHFTLQAKKAARP